MRASHSKKKKKQIKKQNKKITFQCNMHGHDGDQFTMTGLTGGGGGVTEKRRRG